MGGYILGYGATGNSGNYFQVRSKSTAQIANGVGLESYNQSHWGSYVLTCTEQPASSCYVLGIPGYLPVDIYNAVLFTPLGGSPAFGDTPIWDETFYWDGANIIGLNSSLNVGAINGSAQAAINLAASAKLFVPGSAASGVLTTNQMTTNLLSAVPNIYAGRVLYFVTGANAGLAVLVTAYVVTGGQLTFIGFNNQQAPNAPTAGDTFLII